MYLTLHTDRSWSWAASLLLITLVLASCGTRKSAVSRYESSTIQEDLLAYSKRYLGKPYRYAGKGPNAFDCSGFTSFVFKNFGYRLNSSSAGQDRQVPTVARKEELRAGDLVFFEGSRRNGRVGHVGIVTEISPSGRFKFIHASTTSGVIVSSSSEPYYSARYLRGGRVLEDNASYVTRQNPATMRKQEARVASLDHLAAAPAIPEVAPHESRGKGMNGVNDRSPATVEKEKQVVVLVQSDASKNSLAARDTDHGNGRQAEKDTPANKDAGKSNSDVVLRENSAGIPTPPVSHVVEMGETLYSISRRYGCSVEQLKAWNPRLGTVLKAGDTLLVYVSHPG